MFMVSAVGDCLRVTINFSLTAYIVIIIQIRATYWQLGRAVGGDTFRSQSGSPGEVFYS